MPAVERLRRWMWNLAVLAPGIQTVVEDKPRQMGEGRIGGRDCRSIGGRTRQEFPGDLHRRPLGERDFMLLHQLAPPRIDLLVNIDFHGANVRTTPVQRRGEGQVAELSHIERRVDYESDGSRVSGAVTQAATAPIDRAGIHAGTAADAFERGPKLL